MTYYLSKKFSATIKAEAWTF